MNMKLSYRDKVIFIVVMVILVLVAGFFLFIKPKFEAADVAKYNLEVKQQEKADIDAKIDTLPTIIDNLKEVAKDIDETQKMFMDESHPYVNETYIREALASLNIDVTEMNTEYTTANPIERYIVESKNILAYENKINADLYNELPQEVYDKYNNIQREEYPFSIIGVTKMTVKFDSDLELKDAYNAIDKFAEDEKTIFLNSIGTGDISEGSDKPAREIECNLTLYSIFPLNVEKVLQETTEITPIETTAE
ncbi:MAG: hypothetical protein ACI4KG_03530 [Oscillospiraceae bacterium]